MSRLGRSLAALLAALPPGAVAAAQEAEPASAIYVSTCSRQVLAGRCLGDSGERLDTELTALAPDGSVRRVLTDNRLYEHQPVFSPDSARLAFALGRRGWSCSSNRGLRTIDAAGGDFEVLTKRDSVGCDFATDWSPNGRRVLFDRECSLCFEVWWVSADGEHDQRLSTEGDRNDPDAYSSDGHWVDGGKAVVYYKNDYNRDVHGVFRVRPDTTGRRRLGPRMFVDELVVSPDGTWVAFVAMPFREREDGHRDVWVMRSDGSGLRQLTDDVPAEAGLDWSPDGTTVVFVSGDQQTTIVTVGRDGSGGRALEPSEMSGEYFREYDPHWSPDGSEIAFLAERFATVGGDFEYAAYVVAADGSYYRRITEFERDLRVWGWEPLTS